MVIGLHGLPWVMAQLLCLIAPLFPAEGLNQKYGFDQSFSEQLKDLAHTRCSVIKHVCVAGIYAYVVL